MSAWSLNEARSWARERLSAAGIESVDADVRELLEWACDASSQWSLPTRLSEEQAEKLRSGVGERALRIPLQHVTGRMFFRSLTLQSVPGVFIVRPETEVLAGLAIDEAGAIVRERGEARVVDLCTGSGAIAFAVAVDREGIVDLAGQLGAVPDVVVADPPRAGAGAEVCEAIAATGAPRVVLVSCDPAAGARDPRALTEAGYELESLQAWDLFPHTHHVETVSVLSR